MARFVFLLRGINVGGNNPLPMSELKSLMSDNGFKDIQTYIQSGNIVATSSKAQASKLGSIIKTQFDFEPAVLVLTDKEFLSIVDRLPYPLDAGKHVHFYFCSSSPKPDLEKFEKYQSSTEQYLLDKKVCYLYAPDGIGRSKLAANLESCLGTPATGRNLNTVLKLQEMLNN